MEERIKYLFRNYLQNECSRTELEEFFVYVRNSEHDEILKGLIKKVYDSIRHSAPAPAFVDENGDLILTGIDYALTKKRRKRMHAGSLIIMCFAIAGSIFFITRINRNHNSGNNYTKIPAPVLLTKKITERSEFKYLLLPDSTQVWLNAGSSLEFPDHFGENKREVYLHGEAYFDVKHAEKKPFIIHTGEVYTTVLGTAFNIKAYPGQKNIIISVSRGKVRVSRKNEAVAILTKGQQVKVSSTDQDVAEKNIAVNEVAAWQQGNMKYEDESFEDIIEDLQRTYDVRISVANASILNLKVSTSFRREIGIEQALEILCRLTDTGLKQANGIYTIQ
jgi:transmembrane sensor